MPPRSVDWCPYLVESPWIAATTAKNRITIQVNLISRAQYITRTDPSEQQKVYRYISICIENNWPKLGFTNSKQALGNGNSREALAPNENTRYRSVAERMSARSAQKLKVMEICERLRMQVLSIAAIQTHSETNLKRIEI